MIDFACEEMVDRPSQQVHLRIHKNIRFVFGMKKLIDKFSIAAVEELNDDAINAELQRKNLIC